MDDVAFLRLVQSEDKLISETLHEGIQHLEFKEQCAKTSAPSSWLAREYTYRECILAHESHP